MVAAKETDTMVVERSIRNAARIIKNEAALTVARMEAEGATLDDLIPVISGKVGRDAYLCGDINRGTIACGQVVGRIHEIKTCKQIIDDMIAEARERLTAIERIFGA